MQKLATADGKEPANKNDNNNNDSSAEEFAESLQAEMDKMMDESSEEEWVVLDLFPPCVCVRWWGGKDSFIPSSI